MGGQVNARTPQLRRALSRTIAVAIAATTLLGIDDLRASEQPLHIELRSVTLSTRQMRPGTDDQTRDFSGSWQLLHAEGHDLGGSGVSVALGAWAVAAISDSAAEAGTADLVFGHVGWRNKSRSLSVQVGRQGVYVGAPRYVFLDGVRAEAELPANLRLSGYGGYAVWEHLHEALTTPVVGGRLGWHYWKIGHVGVAFQDISVHAQMNRRSLGVDFGLRALDPLRFQGSWAYDLLGQGLQEARIDGILAVNKHLDLTCRAEVRDPLGWLRRASIFTAFVDRTDPVAGLGFHLRTPGALQVKGRYDRFFNEGDLVDGYRGDLEAILRMDARGRYIVGLMGGALNNGDNGFWHARVYATAAVSERLRLSLDVDGYRFMRNFKGYDRAVLSAVAARWQALHGLSFVVDGRVWQNPEFERQAQGMLHVVATQALFARVAAAKPDAAKPDKEASK